MKELIGKKIVGIYVNGDQERLTFVHPDGNTSTYLTYEDCCSETWFADITGVNVLLGAQVLDVSEVPLEEVDDGRSRQEFDAFYGVKLRTDKGYADIVYRNSSNGYYGGSIDYVKEHQNVEDMTSITDDWQA